MPYVTQEQRAKVDELINALCTILQCTELESAPGLTNYIISRIISDDIRRNPCYITINEAIGVLECCKLELYRRLVADYEDQKCQENGDVFDD